MGGEVGIRNLTRALITQNLTNNPERVEMLVIAGIYNIGERQAVPDIIEEIFNMKETVRCHSELHGHKEPSAISFCTVIYAPKFCALDVPPGFPEWTPPPTFRNQRQDIECLNAAIIAINKSAGVNSIGK